MKVKPWLTGIIGQWPSKSILSAKLQTTINDSFAVCKQA